MLDDTCLAAGLIRLAIGAERSDARASSLQPLVQLPFVA